MSDTVKEPFGPPTKYTPAEIVTHTMKPLHKLQQDIEAVRKLATHLELVKVSEQLYWAIVKAEETLRLRLQGLEA